MGSRKRDSAHAPPREERSEFCRHSMNGGSEEARSTGRRGRFEIRSDGRYIEQLGYYDPLTDPAKFQIDAERSSRLLGREPAVGIGRGHDGETRAVASGPCRSCPASPAPPIAAEEWCRWLRRRKKAKKKRRRRRPLQGSRKPRKATKASAKKASTRAKAKARRRADREGPEGQEARKSKK